MMTHPQELPGVSRAVLAGGRSSAAQISARRALRDQLFAHTDGTAAARAAAAIIDLITGDA